MDDLQTSDDKIRNIAEYMKKRGLGDEFTANNWAFCFQIQMWVFKFFEARFLNIVSFNNWIRKELSILKVLLAISIKETPFFFS